MTLLRYREGQDRLPPYGKDCRPIIEAGPERGILRVLLVLLLAIRGVLWYNAVAPPDKANRKAG